MDSAHTNNPIYVLIAATHPVNKLLCLLQDSNGSRVPFGTGFCHCHTHRRTGVGESIRTGHGIPAMCH